MKIPRRYIVSNEIFMVFDTHLKPNYEMKMKGILSSSYTELLNKKN